MFFYVYDARTPHIIEGIGFTTTKGKRHLPEINDAQLYYEAIRGQKKSQYID